MENIFKNKLFVPDELIAYGFSGEGSEFKMSIPIMSGDFVLNIRIEDNSPGFFVTEADSGEVYAPFSAENFGGSFVGRMRAESEAILTDISEKCCNTNVFSSRQAKFFMNYALEKYGDKPEFLWKKFEDDAILRRKDTEKWYAVLMKVKKSKLGLEGDELVEVVDLHSTPELNEALVDGKKIYPGYHMNKKHWLTVCFDDTLPDAELTELTDFSYSLAKKK